MDGATYRSEAVYLQDRFDPSKWLTVIAGVRYGQFSPRGYEDSSFGVANLGGHQSDTTGALNLIVHATPHLNVIGNVFRGFRSPNLSDMTKYGYRLTTTGFGIEVPNPNATPEHVLSYEAAVKYQRSGLQVSAYAYRNRLTDLLAVTNTGYVDLDNNGQKDGFDYDIFQNLNVGRATISGFAIESRYQLSPSSSVWGHYSKTRGTDEANQAPLSFIPGGYGAVGYRFTPAAERQPWLELVWRHQATQRRLGAVDRSNPLFADGIPGFDVVNIRGGLNVSGSFSVIAGVDNVLDEQYREIGAAVYSPARQFILTTRLGF